MMIEISSLIHEPVIKAFQTKHVERIAFLALVWVKCFPHDCFFLGLNVVHYL